MLTPDMSKIWGQVLRKLRESEESSLYALCTDLDNIEFTNDDINIICKNEGIFSILEKKVSVLNNIAGSDVIKVLKPKERVSHIDKTDALRKLFGGKLKVIN